MLGGMERESRRDVRSLFDLDGRTAVVTGGGTHLGTAMAEALAELGATVYLASRDAGRCQAVAATLVDRGWRAVGLRCDATDEGETTALVERVVAETGRLDVLVANAGGHATTTYPPDGRVDELRAAFEMNLVSTYISAQAAARVMIPAGRGSIVTLGSINSNLAADTRIYVPTFRRSGPPYMAAKAGVLNLTRALAVEFGPHGVRVNCLSPGQIPKSTVDPTQVERFREANPLRQTGVPEDIKGAVALLASDAGRFITGSNLIVDGGWSVW
jgi:gluconate 5-dehydrogenase